MEDGENDILKKKKKVWVIKHQDNTNKRLFICYMLENRINIPCLVLLPSMFLLCKYLDAQLNLSHVHLYELE